MNESLEKLEAHVAGCTICDAANKRVNDFCAEGQLLFFEYASTNPPIRFEEVTITKAQYDRLVEEARRRLRSAERN